MKIGGHRPHRSYCKSQNCSFISSLGIFQPELTGGMTPTSSPEAMMISGSPFSTAGRSTYSKLMVIMQLFRTVLVMPGYNASRWGESFERGRGALITSNSLLVKDLAAAKYRILKLSGGAPVEGISNSHYRVLQVLSVVARTTLKKRPKWRLLLVSEILV